MSNEPENRPVSDSEDPEPEENRSSAGLGRKLGQRYVAKPDSSSRGAAYSGAIEAVLAILIATGVGYWADQRFDSSPLLLFTGVALGFAAFILRLLRLRELLEPPEEG